MLRGENVVLREWRETDLDGLASLRNDIELQRLLMTQARPNPNERVRQWLADRSSRDDMLFFVIAGHDDSVLGYVQVASIDRFQGHGELGICLSRAAQGRGVAGEASALLEDYLRTTLALRKLTLKVLVDNTRAIGFYRKHGYRDVGVLRQHFREGNHDYHDVLVMERLLDP